MAQEPEGSCRAEPHSYMSGLETSALSTVPPVAGAQASCGVGRDTARSGTSVGGGSRPEMREGDRLRQDADGRAATSSAACQEMPQPHTPHAALQGRCWAGLQGPLS